MPTLNWSGKDKVVTYDSSVPYHVLNHVYNFGGASENKIIHGDNLLALKSLLPVYESRVKCIYIDPPYNTGNEGWIYNDNVNSPQIQKWIGQVVGREGEDFSRHDKWLCMMYPRLKLLKQLLSDDGAIFISIDDNEVASLKFICDEIFGRQNFVTVIHWRRSESQNNTAKLISVVGEYIVCYLKNKTSDSTFNKINLTAKAIKEYRYKDERGYFRRGTISDNSRGKNIIEIVSPTGIRKTIKSIRTKEFIDEQDKRGLIYWTSGGLPYLKIYLDDSAGQIASNWFDNVGVNEDASEILTTLNIPFEYSKPPSMIEKLISMATDKNSIVLDAFAGSGTTAHAVLNLNKADGGDRKFILVEMESYAENITAERVKRVINGYGKVEGTGGSFDFYEVGEPLFIEDELNENIPLEKIREYVWTIDTRTAYVKHSGDCEEFLGVDDGTAYYYCEGILDRQFLAKIKTRADSYVIYAETCALDAEFMLKYKIEFRKIPRDFIKV